MVRKVSVIILLAVTAMAIAVPVLAAYYIDITVTESSGNDYDMLAMNMSLDVDYLASHQFIDGDGTDVRVKTSGGSSVPFMLADDKVMFISDITADKATNFQLTTDNSGLSSFPIIAGYGGYITIADDDDLELGNDFEIEVDAWVDTSVGIYPIIEAATTSTESTYVTSHDVSLPAGVEDGDLVIILFCAGGGASNNPTITWPDGWTQLDVFTDPDYADGAAYRIADGTEGSTVIVTTSQVKYSVHQAYRISSYQGTPETTTEGFGDPPNSLSLSPSWGVSTGTLWLSFFANREGTTYDASAAPTGYNDLLYLEYSNAPRIGSAWKTSIASSEDPGAFTVTGSIPNASWTLGIEGCTPIVRKDSAFFIGTDGGAIVASIRGGTPKTVTTSALDTGEYTITAWADGTDFGIDIDGSTKDTVALGGVSVPTNDNDWIITSPYVNYYQHTTSDTLRLTYQPDDIISGTTLPNEESPGNYDGTITWGSNPAGVAITHSTLEVEEGYYTSGADLTPDDIFAPEPAGLISGIDLERLSHNPLAPLVDAIVDASRGKMTESLVWILGAWIILIGVVIFLFIKMREHLMFAAIAGCGLSIAFYIMGIFDYWVIIIFGIGVVAAIVHERSPQW